MKILCIIDSLGSGGAQRQLVSVACGLKSRGHHVEFLTYYPFNHFKSELDEANIPVHTYVKCSRFSLRPVFHLRKTIRNEGFEVVLAFLDTPSIYAELACFGLRNVRLIVSERNVRRDGINYCACLFMALLHLLANHIVANSRTHADWMMRSFPWLKNRISVILNGVDTEQFTPQPKNIAKGEAKDIDPNIVRFVSIGRISKQKNLQGLIRALGILTQHNIAFSVDWIGRIDDHLVFDESKCLLEQFQLQNQWNWLGEMGDIPMVIGRYDALILPSLWEGFPNVVCEALASGLPVLASNISDLPNLVENGIRGYLFDPLEAQEISFSMTAFANLSSKQKQEMSSECRRFAVMNLSNERMIDRYEELLSS